MAVKMEEEQDYSALLFHQYQFNDNNTTCDSQSLNQWRSCGGRRWITPRPVAMAGASSSSQFILFDEGKSALMEPKTEIWGSYGNRDFWPSINVPENEMRNLRKSPPCVGDHALAERKRREKLSQRFIALSALLPGLKKMDKASVLGDAIKHIKQLQERVEVLEKKAKNKSIIESVILLKKSHLYNCDNDNDHNQNQLLTRFSDQKLPEIEVKISDKNVLVRIHCERHEGLFAELLGEMEKLNLSIVNGNGFPFGCSTQYMVVVAQINEELNTKSKELIQKLEDILLKFISIK